MRARWSRLRGRVRRAAATLTRPVGFLTPAGRGVVLLTVTAYAGAHEAGLEELALVAALGALLLVLAVPFVLLPTRVEAVVALRPTHTVAGDTGQARLHLLNRSPLPVLHPAVRLPIGTDTTRLRLPVLRRGHEEVVTVAVPTRRRGVVDVGPVLARRTDPFGLLQRPARWGRATELYVRPRMVSLESMSTGFLRDQEGVPSDEVSMSDLAFHALREYVRGDDLRHVHWRSTARAGQLLVRQYHQTRRNHATVLVDDDRSAYADAEDFELAVSVAASLVVRASLDQTDLTFVCGRELVTGQSAADVLDACCRVDPGPGNLAASAGLAAGVTPETTLLLVTGGAAPAGAVQAAEQAFPGEVRALVFRADRASESTLLDVDGVRTVQVARLGDLPMLLTALATVTR